MTAPDKPKSNIIFFPTKKRLEQVKFEAEAVERQELENMVDDIASETLAYIGDQGIDITSRKYVYSVSYFVESARSMIYDMHGIEHPFVDLAVTLYENSSFDNPNQLEFDF